MVDEEYVTKTQTNQPHFKMKVFDLTIIFFTCRNIDQFSLAITESIRTTGRPLKEVLI